MKEGFDSIGSVGMPFEERAANDATYEDHAQDNAEISSPHESQPGGQQESPGPEDIGEQVKAFMARDTAKVDPREEIERGLRLLENLSFNAEQAGESIASQAVRLMIYLGLVFGKQKDLLKAAGEPWGPWFKGNITFVDLRSAQHYMKIAKIPNAEEWAFLTKRRLVEIAPFVTRSKEEDPIQELFAIQGMTPEQAKALPKGDLQKAWEKVLASVRGGKIQASVERAANTLLKQLQEMEERGLEYAPYDYPALEALRELLCQQ